MFAMDVHGDEAIAAEFLRRLSRASRAGPTRMARSCTPMSSACGWRRHTPDFQTEHGYGKSAAGPSANLSMSTNQLAERFGAVSDDAGDAVQGSCDPNPDAEPWLVGRSARRRLAHAMSRGAGRHDRRRCDRGSRGGRSGRSRAVAGPARLSPSREAHAAACPSEFAHAAATRTR